MQVLMSLRKTLPCNVITIQTFYFKIIPLPNSESIKEFGTYPDDIFAI